jgi:hypothetical protein
VANLDERVLLCVEAADVDRRHGHSLAQLVHRPGALGMLVQQTERAADEAVAHAGEPAGPAFGQREYAARLALGLDIDGERQ